MTIFEINYYLVDGSCLSHRVERHSREAVEHEVVDKVSRDLLVIVGGGGYKMVDTKYIDRYEIYEVPVEESPYS